MILILLPNGTYVTTLTLNVVYGAVPTLFVISANPGLDFTFNLE